jgi:Fe-S oxidoreductase
MDQQTLRQWESRCIQEEQPYCQAACPLGVDVRAMLDRLAAGEADAARKVLERGLPLPGLLGLACEAPCEAACKRREAGEALAIGRLERFLVTHARPGGKPMKLPGRGLSAVILGRGPAALVCAWDLLRKGHGATLYSLGRPLGGVLAEAAGLAAALERELATLAALGLKLEPGGDEPAELLARLLAEGRAVFLEHGWSAATDAVWPARAEVDAVTLAAPERMGGPGLFLGGWPGADGVLRVIDAAADGRRAASSLDRALTGASLTASREREGVTQTRLFTSLEGVAELGRVEPAGVDYEAAEAAREADRCLRCQCLECVKVCEYLKHFKAYPKVYARQIYNNAAIVKGQHLANPLVNSCSLCGLCGRVCPEGFDMAELALAARRGMVAAGTMPPSAHELALEDMAAACAPDCALVRPDPRAASAKGPAATVSAAQLFFPGCQLAASRPEHLRAVYALLRGRHGGGVGLMLGCCGLPARWAGREDLFRAAQDAVREAWERQGRPRVIAGCSGCLEALRSGLPDVPAVSLWEALADCELPGQARPGQLRPGGPYALHDPCTARDDAAFRSAVRALAARLGVDVREPALSGEFTECCGFGGLMAATNPPLGREVARRRAASEVDGERLPWLAACAMCRDRLAEAGAPAAHLLDLLFPALAADPVAPGPGLSARRETRARLRRELLRELWGEAAPEPKGGVALRVEPNLLARLEERRILAEDARRVVAGAEAAGRFFVDAASGRRLAAHRPRRVTFWVEYAPEGEGFALVNAWSHRMIAPGVPGPEEDFGNGGRHAERNAGTTGGAEQVYRPESGDWRCSCGGERRELAPRAVEVRYLGGVFTISLLACPACGLTLVPEGLALGRMAEVERMLEDK